MSDNREQHSEEGSAADAGAPPSVVAGGPPLLARRLSLLVRASGFLLGMLVTALAAMLLFISVSFSDLQITSDVRDFIESEYGRTLTAGEGIHLALLPWPRLMTGAVSLSEPDKPDAFAGWQKASFELDAVSLLRHRLVIRHARIEGLTLRLARDSNGAWNADDLFAVTDPAMIAPFSVQLEGLALSHAGIAVNDALNNCKLQWRGVEFGTDALQPNRGGRVRLIAQIVSPEAAVEGKFSLSARYRFGDALASGMLTGVQARYVGDMGTFKTIDTSLGLGSAEWQKDAWKLADLQLGGQAKRGEVAVEWTAALLSAAWQERLQARSGSARLTLRSAAGNAEGINGELRVNVQDFLPDDRRGSAAGLDSSWLLRTRDGSAQGKLRGQLHHDAATGRLGLEKMTGEFSLSHPMWRGGAAAASLKGDAGWRPSTEDKAAQGELNIDARFGQDTVRAALSLVPGHTLSGPRILARVETQRFDVDRLIAMNLHGLTLPSAESLQGWALDGVVHGENLKVAGMRIALMNVPVKVADGKLALPEHELLLYGGKLNGSIGYDPAKPALNVFEALRETQLDALSQDSKLALPLTGFTNATLEVRSEGATLKALPDTASGVLRVYARNARWHGVDLPRSMLALNANRPAVNTPQSETLLSEVSAAFAVKGPVLVADKVTARSDALTLAGVGTIHYASGEMDLQLNARAGSERSVAELRGKRMALRARGPIMRPALSLDAASARR